MPEKQEKIGALWVKKSSKGEYMTGEIIVSGEKIKVVAFYNANKKNEKQPDWDLLIARPKEETADNPGDVVF